MVKKGKLGHPKYDRGDIVEFELTIEDKKYKLQGEVGIIDSYGTFDMTKENAEPSYDILVEDMPVWGGRCLCKHIPESCCELVKKGESSPLTCI